MYKTITSFVTTLLLLGVENHVCNAQFGVAGNKKGSASSFESMNEQAKKQYEGGGLADMMDMGALADMLGGEVDMAELEALVAEAMSDPETMEEMMKMQKEMMQAMNQLGDMSPEELMKTAADAVEAMMDTDVLDSMFEDTDALIEQLEQSGMVDAAMIDNPNPKNRSLQNTPTPTSVPKKDEDALQRRAWRYTPPKKSRWDAKKSKTMKFKLIHSINEQNQMEREEGDDVSIQEI